MHCCSPARWKHSHQCQGWTLWVTIQPMPAIRADVIDATAAALTLVGQAASSSYPRTAARSISTQRSQGPGASIKGKHGLHNPEGRATRLNRRSTGALRGWCQRVHRLESSVGETTVPLGTDEAIRHGQHPARATRAAGFHSGNCQLCCYVLACLWSFMSRATRGPCSFAKQRRVVCQRVPCWAGAFVTNLLMVALKHVPPSQGAMDKLHNFGAHRHASASTPQTL